MEIKKFFQCDTCDKPKTFFTLKALQSHISLIHEKNNTHKCDSCERTFPLLSKLKFHLKFTHNVKKLPCDICDKIFAEHLLAKHKETVHERIKKLQCNLCEKRYFT